MKIGHEIKFVVINKIANSLYSLIADGQYRATSLGRDTWKTLIGVQASLQRNCNREGFNAASGNSKFFKTRIGILSNNEGNCESCDSMIGFGFGTGGEYHNSNTSGNEAVNSVEAEEGEKSIKAMGYVFVQ